MSCEASSFSGGKIRSSLFWGSLQVAIGKQQSVVKMAIALYERHYTYKHRAHKWRI